MSPKELLDSLEERYRVRGREKEREGGVVLLMSAY